MNKRQIVKISYKNSNLKVNDYAICVDPQKDIYLTYKGEVIVGCNTGQIVKNFVSFSITKLSVDNIAFISVLNDVLRNEPNSYKRLSYSFGIRNIDVLDLAATRNVPVPIRENMLQMEKETSNLLTKALKFVQIYDSFNKEYKQSINSMNTSIENIRENMGLLTEEEFVEEFKNNLSSKMKRAIELTSSVRDMWGNKAGEWEFEAAGDFAIQIRRDIWLDKYINPKEYDFVYREYDDTLFIDNENTKQYKDIISKYHKELPTSCKLNEHLFLGDKNSLNYEAYYSIEYDKSKPKTKEYAKKLADSFCGIKKEKETKEHIEEEIER